MKIRNSKKEDFDVLAEIFTKAYNSINIGEHWNRQSAKKMLLHLYNSQPDLTFTVESEGKIIGAINAIIKPWWDGNHITDGEIFVDPKYQKKGIGKKLIKHLFKEAQKKYQAISWDTFTHVIHEHPLEWYKSMGFDEISEWSMITGDIKVVLKNLDES